MNRATTILPTRSITADMIGRIEKPARLSIPQILSDEAALEQMAAVGEFDQLKLKNAQRKMSKAMKAAGYVWCDQSNRWVL